MNQYLLLFRGGDAHIATLSPEDAQTRMQKWMLWMDGLSRQDRLIDAQPLDLTGKILTGTKKVMTDGPFMEGKEMVGGYVTFRAGNYDEAVEIARGCPQLLSESGIVEVREIKEIEM